MSKIPVVAIVGRANVGKSSLFNRILGEREAIVANEPGTTRDSVTRVVESKGSAFWLVDTAGLKIAEDEFEASIQDQIIEAADSADVIIVAVEAHTQLTEEDRRVAKLALKSQKPVVLVMNKADKAQKLDLSHWEKSGIKQRVATSAIHGEGITELLAKVGKQLPKAKKEDRSDALTIALIGRPNVGKSYLFNTLGQKQQAIVANVAGTTRDINRVNIKLHGQNVTLLDTAGIRRSGKIGKGIEHFSVLRTLQAIEEADVCCLLMDVNELNTALDQKIAGMVKESGKGLIIVVSKWDTAEKDAYTRDKLAPQISYSFQHVWWAPLIFTSSETGQNVTKIYDLARDIASNRNTQVLTRELNQWIAEVVAKHPPAGLKGKHPKLRYITQTGQNPPTMTVFGNYTEFLHWSYKRYLERELREKYELTGTPVRFKFSNGDKETVRVHKKK